MGASTYRPRDLFSCSEIIDLLAALIDKSLVVAEPEGAGPRRYRLLETVRQYALERLEEHGARPYASRVHPKIAIMGASGSGKTTFAAELARRLGVPHIELDALHHGPNWTELSADEFRRRVRTVMDAAGHGWVIDGNYERKLDRLVTNAADTIVWLDLPLWILLHRLWRRTSHRIRGNVELWNGNRETWRGAFWGRESLFAWTIRAFLRHRRNWPRRFGSHPGFIRLRTPDEVRQWLQRQT